MKSAWIICLWMNVAASSSSQTRSAGNAPGQITTSAVQSSNTATAIRPIIANALYGREDTGTLYYFAFGSNLLKSKLESRSPSDKIEHLSCTPGVARSHRLAFNMRGIIPLEPAMAALEPSEGGECHGVLYEMTPGNYERVWRSEGGARPRPSYTECIVEVTPYGSKQPVQAISLCTSKHVKTAVDLSPSLRYMSLIIQGARESGLDEDYICQLEDIPTSTCSPLLRHLGLYYLYAFGLFFRFKLLSIHFMMARLLTALYAPPSASLPRRLLYEALAGAALLPASLLGLLVSIYVRLTGKETSLPFKNLVEYYSVVKK